MRSNQKSDVPKHFSNRKIPLFLHKNKMEDHAAVITESCHGIKLVADASPVNLAEP
jgi:hypothetical protein